MWSSLGPSRWEIRCAEHCSPAGFTGVVLVYSSHEPCPAVPQKSGVIVGKAQRDGLRVQTTKPGSRCAGWPKATVHVGCRCLRPRAPLQGHCQTARCAKPFVLRVLRAQFCSGPLYPLLFSRQRLSTSPGLLSAQGFGSQPNACLP